MSGTSYGACVRTSRPSRWPAALAFVRDGDIITLDVLAPAVTRVADDELARRRASRVRAEVRPARFGRMARAHHAGESRVRFDFEGTAPIAGRRFIDSGQRQPLVKPAQEKGEKGELWVCPAASHRHSSAGRVAATPAAAMFESRQPSGSRPLSFRPFTCSRARTPAA